MCAGFLRVQPQIVGTLSAQLAVRTERLLKSVSYSHFEGRFEKKGTGTLGESQSPFFKARLQRV